MPEQDQELKSGKNKHADEIPLQTAKEYYQMVARHRRKMRIERFFEQNPLAWFFNEFPPQDMYKSSPENRRNTRQEMRYHWLRQRTSWTFLSHLTTSTGIRFAAIGGLVSAFFQAAPGLRGEGVNGEVFNWLLIAGLLYLIAGVWFSLSCPLLLKQTLKGTPRYLGQHHRRWLQALVEDELRRWWKKIEWLPHPARLQIENNAHDRTTLVIMQSYGVPAFSGFGVYACAHIESALHEYEIISKTRPWRQNRCNGKLEAFSPSVVYESSRPLVRSLSLSRVDEYLAEQGCGAKVGDLVVHWHDSNVEISHQVPKRSAVHISREAEGLVYLFAEDGSASVFAEIVAFWQESMYPWRRLIMILLLSMSASSFAWFVYLQLKTVLSAL
ncbi:DUF308 domain-containing protein [Pseudomonas sp. AOB-7]|uniref:DUF308 domain-containing protein n=1 Tax=Pseudomonas sp. AOB-7 TaxID=2482750 RepID=UPI0011C36FA2|nr:DUF308 domain-containing protein [Pseudomonas sp. AOB-7]